MNEELLIRKFIFLSATGATYFRKRRRIEAKVEWVYKDEYARMPKMNRRDATGDIRRPTSGSNAACVRFC
jgi:hypothetical protein